MSTTTLEPMTVKQTAQIVAAASELLRAAVRGDSSERTAKYRQVADLLIDLRALHTAPDGSPDWAGRSFDYRAAVRDIYSLAGLSSDSSDPHKAALRYHIGNALRERLTPDQLEEAGLTKANPRDRQLARHLEESTARPTPELIAQLAVLVERLTASKDNGVTPRDLNRVRNSVARLSEWLDTRD